MKVAFIYGPMSVGQRMLRFDDIWTNERGLTGSELSCLSYARGLRDRDHEVILYTMQPVGAPYERQWEGIAVRAIDQRTTFPSDLDAVCTWNEPDILRFVPSRAVRMVNQQLNDFQYCKPGFAEHVDFYTSPSAHHMAYMMESYPEIHPWFVLPNGCDPSSYRDGPRKPGKIIWASSPDRGLHLLLQVWGSIKKAVPEAHLDCFYNMDYGPMEEYDHAPGRLASTDPGIMEVAQRIRYIRYALKRLERLGVVHHGSVSRARMIDEMSQAMVLAYPCETIRYTEGFSVTTIEACAAGVVPIISDTDALGSIYGRHVPTVPNPASAHLQEFTDLVIRGLVDEPWRQEVRAKARALAEQYTWAKLAEQLETLLRDRSHTTTAKALKDSEPALERDDGPPLDLLFICGNRDAAADDSPVPALCEALAAQTHRVRVAHDGDRIGTHAGVEYTGQQTLRDPGRCDAIVVCGDATWLDADLTPLDAGARVLWMHDAIATGMTRRRTLRADRIVALSEGHKKTLCQAYELSAAHVVVMRAGRQVETSATSWSILLRQLMKDNADGALPPFC